MTKEVESELAAVEVYQLALKRIARVLEQAEENMVKARCYWRVRRDCNDLIVAVKMQRVGALCELSNIRKGA